MLKLLELLVLSGLVGSMYVSIVSTSHFHSSGILLVLEFIVRKTEVSFPVFHRYENQDRLRSDQFGKLHFSFPYMSNHPLHMYQG